MDGGLGLHPLLALSSSCPLSSCQEGLLRSSHLAPFSEGSRCVEKPSSPCLLGPTPSNQACASDQGTQ